MIHDRSDELIKCYPVVVKGGLKNLNPVLARRGGELAIIEKRDLKVYDRGLAEIDKGSQTVCINGLLYSNITEIRINNIKINNFSSDFFIYRYGCSLEVCSSSYGGLI